LTNVGEEIRKLIKEGVILRKYSSRDIKPPGTKFVNTRLLLWNRKEEQRKKQQTPTNVEASLD
jgi:hypothetical protein